MLTLTEFVFLSNQIMAHGQTGGHDAGEPYITDLPELIPSFIMYFNEIT